MLMTMKKAFPFSRDGRIVERPLIGETVDIPEHMVQHCLDRGIAALVEETQAQPKPKPKKATKPKPVSAKMGGPRENK